MPAKLTYIFYKNWCFSNRKTVYGSILSQKELFKNIIKSPGEGVVKSIAVGERQAVDKNQVLIELM